MTRQHFSETLIPRIDRTLRMKQAKENARQSWPCHRRSRGYVGLRSVAPLPNSTERLLWRAELPDAWLGSYVGGILELASVLSG